MSIIPQLYRQLYRVLNEKEVAISRNLLIFSAPFGVEMLNLWNDFRKVVKFIDENPWLRPLMERIKDYKNRGGK